MTKPKPRPLGSTLDVAEGAQIVRPDAGTVDARTVVGGVYVFDMIGTHTIDGTEYEVVDEAQPKP